MSLANVITMVTARLAAIDSTRNVYSYVRGVKEPKDFLDLFASIATGGAKNIHAWVVTRDATATRDEGLDTYRDVHNIVMMGYYTVQDKANSEGHFQQIVEDVRNGFNPLSLRRYGGTVDWSQPVQVEGITTLTWGGYLVHAVKLTHKVEEVCFE